MRRIHIGLNVQNLEASVQFYSDLFGAEPSVVKDDYAKWQLDDPRVNFSISSRCTLGHEVHFGIQVESEEELSETAGRLRQAWDTFVPEDLHRPVDVVDRASNDDCVHRVSLPRLRGFA